MNERIDGSMDIWYYGWMNESQVKTCSHLHSLECFQEISLQSTHAYFNICTFKLVHAVNIADMFQEN